MIKLFWNTENHNLPDLNKQTDKDILDHKWGIYHKKNSDKWIFSLLNKVQFESINHIKKLKKEDILIIVDSSPEKKEEFYINLKSKCHKIFLIHLGDESGIYNLNKIYDHFNFVWRAFCFSKFFNNSKVKCIPIGYKSGVSLDKNNTRKYKWSFIGTPHRSSRHDLLFQLSDIEPSFCHKTSKFNEQIIDTMQMNKVLSLSEFIPCPNGFFHPETYRVYEALECGCIPIVENAFKYYDRLFPNNPFIKVDKWVEARSVIKNWNKDQIIKKREECQLWWRQYKNMLQEDIFNRTKL